jgi:hypothetical protein
LKAYSLCCLEKYADALDSVNESIRLNDFKHSSEIAGIYYNRVFYKAKLKRDESELKKALYEAFALNKKYIEYSLSDKTLNNYDIKSLVKEYNKAIKSDS